MVPSTEATEQVAEQNSIATYVKFRQGKRVIKKVLIANNGMAATKSIMSMRRWAFIEFGDEQALTFIAMATHDDLNANAEFIRLADSFVEVPSGKNIHNYANVELICKIAKEQGVDAVWPGWGHASENPQLPATLKELGITFIGPTESVMSALGDKIAANILAQTAKVPSIPWSGDGLETELTPEGTIPHDVFMKAMVNTVEDAVDRAGKIGYPVMVKASEGGGGKGIRKAANAEELKTAFINVQAEVPGSPIFMMQMCSEARHLEVQILGDEYGNTCALNGRDCSTQRRFQKIFEEGPPVIATASTFKEMERAAQRLTALVGYRGAGTVEYLYSAAKDKFYFLELNPRLQVEHPVTEGITGVNLPATQLQIAMGIPLQNIPDIRRFYGLDPQDILPIDFMAADYPPIENHVMASRITAENPDEGFKPTSGKINSVRFQSSSDCWGYFSVGQKGGIHEFADSQFGHVFAKGKNRNEARKNLLFALKNIDITGDIRHPVDYLVDLLETEDFKKNTIDTMWLDRLIAGKLISPSIQALDVVFFAAVYRGYELVKKRTQDMITSLSKGQLVLLGKSDTDALVSFPLEIVFDGQKFGFQVLRSRADTLMLSIGQKTIKAKVREQPDGSLYVSVGKAVQQIKGTEEALGLRLMIGAATVMLPTVYDPSELRSDVNGKVVRYLHDEGADIAKGEPFVELEAMKMIMALKSTEAGKISHAKSAGSIVSAGELLASLQLKDPSKVQKIEPFEGEFKFGNAEEQVQEPESAEDKVWALLEGYEVSERGPLLVERMFENFASPTAAADVVQKVLDKYLESERAFAASILDKQPYDAVLRQLITDNKDSMDKLILQMVAHNKLAQRHDVILAVLREIIAAVGSGMSCMYVPDIQMDKEMDSAVYPRIAELSGLPSQAAPAGDFGTVRYLAQQLLDVIPSESHDDRVKNLRDEFENLSEETPHPADAQLGMSSEGGLDLELMIEMLTDAKEAVRTRATKTYLGWLCLPSRISKLELIQRGELHVASWTQHYPVNEKERHHRHGLIMVIPELGQLDKVISSDTLRQMIAHEDKDRGPMVADDSRAEVPLNLLHIVVGRDAFPGVTDRTLFYNTDEEMTRILQQCTEAFARKAEVLKAAGVGEICLVLPQPPRHPRFAIFKHSSDSDDWSENRLSRDMWPSFVNLIELNRLKRAYSLKRIHKEVRPTSHIYLATQPSISGPKAPAPELFMRGLYYRPVSADSLGAALSDYLVVAMEEIEHAMLDPCVAMYSPSVASRIFLHIMPELSMTADDIMDVFQTTINEHVGEHGSDMLKLCIDEIEVKVRRSTGESVETLRLSSSSLGGGYMKMRMLREFPDPITGVPTRWQNLTGSGSTEESSTAPDRTALGKIQAKRVAARRAGSTYAYDLPGLLKMALGAKWSVSSGLRPSGSSANLLTSTPARGRTLGRGRTGSNPDLKRVGSRDKLQVRGSDSDDEGKKVPDDLMSCKELIMEWQSMRLVETDRPEGTNDIGMLAWKVNLKTPEYPEGRDIVLIANDVTFQAGSFGVREDQFFQKASQYARELGIPRIYVSCNSGARVGLVEELKPLYKVQWIDPADPGKGFEHLYLTKEDYEKLPPNTVEAHPVTQNGEKRYIIDAIIGQSQKSTAGGIGVENLQGSGLIAGETSRAYQETFTLSYITGRSVGIGAYLNRLGQRNIQMVSSPMILTGYNALNKLLGKNVYSSQDQLGGPQIMVPNGVTHQVVRDDQEGISAILDWLSFVPKNVDEIPPMVKLSSDPWNRDVEFVPSKQPYDPRDFLQGTITDEGERLRGFFDTGSFLEYLEGWGRTVVVGRARLGGIPMGVIAVETRGVERFIPADPANSESCEVVEPQAGQVWFPDSAFKTAQALRDFNRAENLPVMIFANWRGFSGGTRDMYAEILKYGAQIVDALVEYNHPIFIYIPPNGELRGGAWVVIDPAINPDKMEMYADVESRGGILEPAGIVEVKYRAPHQVEAMHRHDTKMQELDAKLAKADGEERAQLEKQVKARERQLLPLYTSIAERFADLHDRTGRMKAKGVIRQGVEWKNARRYFFWRVKRRVLQDFLVKKIRDADKRLKHDEAVARVKSWADQAKVNFEDNEQMADWLEQLDAASRVEACKQAYLKAQLEAVFKEMSPTEQQTVLETAARRVQPPAREVAVPAAPAPPAASKVDSSCSVM